MSVSSCMWEMVDSTLLRVCEVLRNGWVSLHLPWLVALVIYDWEKLAGWWELTGYQTGDKMGGKYILKNHTLHL